MVIDNDTEEQVYDLFDNIQQTNLKVTTSNILVNSKYDLTRTEHRIIRCCIAKINSLDGRRPRKIRLYVSEFLLTFPIANPYKELKKACDSLYHRELDSYNHVEKCFTRGRWVQSIGYSKENAYLELEFTDTIKDELYAFNGSFLTYKLKTLGKFKSKHSIRMYELLEQFKTIGNRSFTIKELRSLLCLENKYPIYKDFKRSVLELAIEEINSSSDIFIKYSFKTKGRSVDAVNFSIFCK